MMRPPYEQDQIRSKPRFHPASRPSLSPDVGEALHMLNMLEKMGRATAPAKATGTDLTPDKGRNEH